jgi:alpha-L-fucosidase
LGPGPWTTFGEGPTTFEPKTWLNELQNPMTTQDIRFTQSKDGRTLYAIVCGVPSEPVRIKSLAKTNIAAVSLLGSGAKLDWKQEGDALVIQPVAKWPTDHAVAFKIALDKE